MVNIGENFRIGFSSGDWVDCGFEDLELWVLWTSDDDVGGQEIDFVRTSFFFYPGKLGSDSHTQLVCTYHRNPLACYLSLFLNPFCFC